MQSPHGDAVLDMFSRPLRDLRLSVTDRCNLRCTYCMPREVFGPDHFFLTKEMILNYEEITRLVAAISGLGLKKIRLTGGEPLLRRGLPQFISMLKNKIPEDIELAMTTNGILLPTFASQLAEAGLDRV
ncbi:MAG: radical SAM protein, partial [Candidatus Poseidoniaceae archaeon]|nr:radical SAM protein [Candidatus Poseidoniaceae archaeon]